MNELLKEVEKAIIELKSRLKSIDVDLKSNGYPSIEHIKTRIKTRDSIEAKMKRKKLEATPENIKNNIRDLGGVRVTVLFIEDVYRIFSLLQMQNDLGITRVKDYIKHPKKSGYQSLHMNILVPIRQNGENKKVEIELQIRTVGMDFFASVEHLLAYKKDNVADDIHERLYKCSEMVTQLDKELFDIYKVLKDK